MADTWRKSTKLRDFRCLQKSSGKILELKKREWKLRLKIFIPYYLFRVFSVAHCQIAFWERCLQKLSLTLVPYIKHFSIRTSVQMRGSLVGFTVVFTWKELKSVSKKPAVENNFNLKGYKKCCGFVISFVFCHQDLSSCNSKTLNSKKELEMKWILIIFWKENVYFVPVMQSFR